MKLQIAVLFLGAVIAFTDIAEAKSVPVQIRDRRGLINVGLDAFEKQNSDTKVTMMREEPGNVIMMTRGQSGEMEAMVIPTNQKHKGEANVMVIRPAKHNSRGNSGETVMVGSSGHHHKHHHGHHSSRND